ncbi:MAG: family 78 glycoside hydrolase catalytic domain [Bacteroidota bacterium]
MNRGSLQREVSGHPRSITGESIDNNKDQPGWNKTGFDESKWVAVKIKPNNDVNLIATYNEPIRKHETFKPVKVFTTPKGEQIIDFGQNLVGWVQLKVSGKAGDKIKITHAEVLDKEGKFLYREPSSRETTR